MNFTISNEKLEAVVRIFNNETDPKATDELIKTEICADWHEGDEHQEWVDSASPQEIADWLASFYSHDISKPRHYSAAVRFLLEEE